MSKMVKVRYIGPRGVCEVSLEEAREILEATYNHKLGGMVVDASTGKTIRQIKDDVEEIIVFEHISGSG
jgi:hypothetical protein